MDFSLMNGYEFERFISALVEHLGFKAEQTALSGDGGIDIYAYCDKPLLHGNYLIQCKNWKKPVGEPQVRDLYGVVMSKHANKGILITTSSFTDQAVAFANGLNIELIDGKALNNLIADYDNTLSINYVKEISSFSEDESFEKERFIYLKKRVESNRDYNSYEEYLAFLLSYMVPQCFVPQRFRLVKKGIDIEIINMCDDIINRFCKRGKGAKEKRNEHLFIKSYICFITGKLATCIECMNDIGLFLFNLRADSFVPCRTALFGSPLGINSNKQQKDSIFLDNAGIFGNVYLIEDSIRKEVMVSNLLILMNTIEANNDLANFETFIAKGISKQVFKCSERSQVESAKVIQYLANYSMEAINQTNRRETVNNKGYKWYPYYFSLVKGDEFSINYVCYGNRAIDIQRSLVDNWDNIETIKKDVNHIAHVLGFI